MQKQTSKDTFMATIFLDLFRLVPSSLNLNKFFTFKVHFLSQLLGYRPKIETLTRGHGIKTKRMKHYKLMISQPHPNLTDTFCIFFILHYPCSFIGKQTPFSDSILLSLASSLSNGPLAITPPLMVASALDFTVDFLLSLCLKTTLSSELLCW